MKISNPALDRVYAQRAARAAKHQGAQPSELILKQVESIDAREREIDEARAVSAPPKKPSSLRDMRVIPVTLQPEPSTPDLDAALAAAQDQESGGAA